MSDGQFTESTRDTTGAQMVVSALTEVRYVGRWKWWQTRIEEHQMLRLMILALVVGMALPIVMWAWAEMTERLHREPDPPSA